MSAMMRDTVTVDLQNGTPGIVMPGSTARRSSGPKLVPSSFLSIIAWHGSTACA